MLTTSSIEMIKNKCINEKDTRFLISKCEDLYDKIIIGICKGNKPFNDQNRQAAFLLIDIFMSNSIIKAIKTAGIEENKEERKAVEGLFYLVGEVLKNEIMNTD